MTMPLGAGENARAFGPRSVQDDIKIRDFLARMASSLTSGDVETLAHLWETPVFVLDDDGAEVLDSLQDMKNFFAAAKASYHKRGIVATSADIMQIEWLTQRIAIVDVRWPHLDASGHERSAECATYTLRFDDSNTLRLRSVVLRGVTRVSHSSVVPKL
jgi:hypothetical protein